MTPERTAAQEWRAHWGLIFAGMLGMFMLSIPAVTLGLFMEPLEAAFGWSRAEISFGMTVFAFITTPLAPFAGALADRHGSRRVVLPGIALNGLALAAFALLTGFFWLYLMAWVFYALTQLLIRTTVWNRAASATFHASRGLALAVMMGGIPLAQMVAPVAAEWLIGDFGWRAAYAAFGLGWGGITLLAAYLLFHEDRKQSALPEGTARTEPQPQAGGLSLGEALRDVRIWRIAMAILLQSVLATAISIHIFPILTEAGLSRTAAATMVGLLGLAALGGQLLTGFLADRVSSTLLPVSCFILPGIAFFLLMQGGQSILLLAFGVVLVGYAASANVAITTYLTSRYVGVRHFGKIYGIISSCMGLGAGVGPLIAGRVFDLTGNYDMFLTGGIVLAAINAVLVFRLGPYPDFTSHNHSEG